MLGVRIVPGIEITAVENERDVHVLGYFIDPDMRAAGRLSARAAQRPDQRRVGRWRRASRRSAIAVDVDALLRRQRGTAEASAGRRLPMRWSRPVMPPIATTRSSGCSAGAGRRSSRAAAPAAPTSIAHHPRGRRDRVARASGHPRRRCVDPAAWSTPGSTRSRCGTATIRRAQQEHYSALAARFGWPAPAGPISTATARIAPVTSGAVSLPPEEFAALEARALGR